MIILVITGTKGTVTKGLKKHLEAIPGKTFNSFTTKDSYTSNVTQYGKHCCLKLEA
jgi:hypothetical protein